LPALQQRVATLFQENRFRSIDAAANEMKSVGWTTPDGLVPASFEDHDPWLGNALYMGIRIDQKKVPAGALRVRRLEAEAAEHRHVGERIPPARRREIAEKIHSDLLTRCVPSTSIHTLLWDVQSGRVLFSATAEAAQAAFLGLFRATFEELVVKLVPLHAMSLPDHVGLTNEQHASVRTALPLTLI
jgi:DNA recombination-dependent growth factor C